MKKYTILIIITILIVNFNSKAQVGINSDGTNPDASAMLDIKSTDKGFLPPSVRA